MQKAIYAENARVAGRYPQRRPRDLVPDPVSEVVMPRNENDDVDSALLRTASRDSLDKCVNLEGHQRLGSPMKPPPAGIPGHRSTKTMASGGK